MPSRTINLSINTKGEDVRVLHDALLRSGYQLPADEKGTKLFGSATRAAIFDFQLKNGLASTGIADEATLGKLGALALEQNLLKVTGDVVTGAGIGAAGLRVIAVDRSLGKEALLGNATTDDQGSYVITYSVDDLKKLGKQKADIEVRVIDRDNPAVVYATSDVCYNVDDDVTVDIVLDRTIVGEATEHSRIIADLKPHIGDVKLGSLQENDKRQDISYLANKTGWDARTIAMAALADQFSQRSGATPIPAPFDHSLFRAGLPTSEDALYNVDSGTVEAVWKQAIDEGLIPEATGKDIPAMVRRFQGICAQKLRTAPRSSAWRPWGRCCPYPGRAAAYVR